MLYPGINVVSRDQCCIQVSMLYPRLVCRYFRPVGNYKAVKENVATANCREWRVRSVERTEGMFNPKPQIFHIRLIFVDQGGHIVIIDM